MQTLKTIILWAAVAAVAAADVKAVIDGPDESRPGDLIVLSAMQAQGDGIRWIAPDGVATLTCSERELATAIGTPGRYTFTLIVADTEARIDYATHTIVVGKLEPRPDPIPDDPVEPDPPDVPNPGKFEQLRKLSAERSASLGDPETAAGLAAAIRATDAQMEQMCKSGQCPGLAAAKMMMVSAIEQRLAQRRGTSVAVNWLDGWRKPMDSALKQINAADVPTYRAAMRALATGLDG